MQSTREPAPLKPRLKRSIEPPTVDSILEPILVCRNNPFSETSSSTKSTSPPENHSTESPSNDPGPPKPQFTSSLNENDSAIVSLLYHPHMDPRSRELATLN